MTTMSQRIRLSRTKGWRKPEGAVVVARPTKWGNPFTLTNTIEAGFLEKDQDAAYQRKFLTEVFDDWLTHGPKSDWWFDDSRESFDWMRSEIGQLRGKDLACWCPLDQHCHADVLIERANHEEPKTTPTTEIGD